MSKSVVETERLILRDFQSEDWERIHIYGSVADFTKYEVWGPNSVEDTKNFIAEAIAKSNKTPRYQFELAVCLKAENLLIGGCGIRRDTELSNVANLGWAINPEFQNKGYATEAAKALVEFGFKKLKLAVIYANCDTRNIASYKVMQKLGMQNVGLSKGDRIIDSQIFDSFRYEILR